MLYIIVVCAFFTITCAAVLPEDSQAAIVSYDNRNDGSGTYSFSFSTSNGIIREETGYLVNDGEENEHIVVDGKYSYIDPDGMLIRVTYTADENGFRIIDEDEDEGTASIQSVPQNVVATLLGK